jgi:hypothetical protein
VGGARLIRVVGNAHVYIALDLTTDGEGGMLDVCSMWVLCEEKKAFDIIPSKSIVQTYSNANR